MVHVQVGTRQDFQALHCKAAFLMLDLQNTLSPPQMKHFELHDILVSPFLKPVEVSSSRSLMKILNRTGHSIDT